MNTKNIFISAIEIISELVENMKDLSKCVSRPILFILLIIYYVKIRKDLQISLFKYAPPPPNIKNLYLTKTTNLKILQLYVAITLYNVFHLNPSRTHR